MEKEPPAPEVEERLEAIAERYLEALRAGVPPDRGTILATHPDIAARLEKRLRMTELLHEAGSDEARAEQARGGTRLRCPHCGHELGPADRPPDEARASAG